MVLEGTWHRGFETSLIELVDGQEFVIWVDIWDSPEFAAESNGFFERVSSEFDLSVSTSLRVRAEGSFYYQPRKDGGGFGHLGAAEALFVIDRILLLERIAEKNPTK